MKRFWWRHQGALSRTFTLKAGVGALLGIGLIAGLGEMSELPLLIAPFGSTCALLFLVPESPLSQPANVIGGHLIASVVALAADAVLPETWWAMGLAVGLAIIAMGLLRIAHPPAAANPVVVMYGHPGIGFILMPVMLGVAALVVLAIVWHRLPPRRVIYPLPLPGSASAQS